MPRFFAFLRAINAGPGRSVRMNVLREVFESLNFLGVATLLASGNVVFETKATEVRTLEKKVAKRLRSALGYYVPVFIRTDAELKQIAAREPFGRSQLRGAGVNIIFLADDLDERSRARTMALRSKTDEFRIRGREIYWRRRRKPGTLLFTTVPFEKVLGERFTIRSTNTIRKLVARFS
jgi:uncharacterized protein (DUF1697 family)